MKCEHILIIRFSALGDVAMTVPVVHSLAVGRPDVRIAVLSRPAMAPLFERMPPNVTFMAADVKGEYDGILGLNRLYRRLVAKGFTAVADLHDTLRSKYLRTRFDLTSVRVEHIDKHRAGRRALVRSKDKILEQQPSPIDNYIDVFKRLGYPIEMCFEKMFGDEGADLTSLPEGEWRGEKMSPWVGVAPFAGHKGKEYPAELMRETIAMIADRHRTARIFVFGGKADSARIDEMTSGIDRCVNVAGKLGLSGDLALISHLDVMVSMDSANMHLASLTGTPVVSVWGSTHPLAGFMGWRQECADAVQVEMPCRPCAAFGADECMRDDFACLTTIKPSDIADKVLEKLADAY